MEVDARQVAGDSGSYGLAFGFSWGEWTYEGYQFPVDPHRQQYLLEKRDMDGTWTTLLAWTYSSAIQQGIATNHLQSVREGEDLRLTVNGAHLASTTSPASSVQGGMVASGPTARPRRPWTSASTISVCGARPDAVRGG
jgi:hypothetical protein